MEMQEDIGQQVMDKLDELEIALGRTHNKLQKKVEGKKNSHLHFLIETEVIEKMKAEAEKQNISLSEWCRRKLREDFQWDRIEMKLDMILIGLKIEDKF